MSGKAEHELILADNVREYRAFIRRFSSRLENAGLIKIRDRYADELLRGVFSRYRPSEKEIVEWVREAFALMIDQAEPTPQLPEAPRGRRR